MKDRLLTLLICLALCAAAASCHDDTDGPEPGTGTRAAVRRIAVMCPQEWRPAWERTASWAVDNIGKAQSGLTDRVALEIDWYDEDAPDIADTAYGIATGGEYDLIIGPTTSALTYKVARQVEGRIPMMLPITTATELQRIYGGRNSMWFFTQSDISQCEILLTQARLGERSSVALIASDDEYGRSFNDWFAYQAIELGLKVDRIALYRNAAELEDAVRSMDGQRDFFRKALIFAPSREDDVLVFDRVIGDLKEKHAAEGSALFYPHVLCSDMVNSPKLSGRISNLRYEGVNPSADPRSGWAAAYLGRFGLEPGNGEAQFYDALLLSAFSLRDGENLNDAIMRVVDGRDGALCDGWTATDMQATFSRLASGENPDIRDVTGDWTWDAKNHNSVTGTFYAHWIYDGGRFVTLEYLTLNGADGSISSTQAWEWMSQYRQEFDAEQQDISYPALADRYAVVVGASDTWSNYRHQADALAMYRMLRAHGYDDAHIILVIEDNLAYHPSNLFQGEVRVTPDGENLYHDVHVDYHLSDISVDDLADIMAGNRSDRLPEVISPGPNDNVVMFWCGHGADNTLMWGSDSYVDSRALSGLIRRLQQDARFRKLLFVLDACYSGTIGEACEGIPGTLVFTAAHANEPSKADMFDRDLNVWLSNGFTRTFRETVTNRPNISFRDLYYEVARGTTGSHPHIYNAAGYGNLLHESIKEFL